MLFICVRLSKLDFQAVNLMPSSYAMFSSSKPEFSAFPGNMNSSKKTASKPAAINSHPRTC